MVEGHTVGRFFTCWPERRPARAGEASKPTSHAQIGRFFNDSWGGGWPHSDEEGKFEEGTQRGKGEARYLKKSV